jgi:hypothetical protein
VSGSSGGDKTVCAWRSQHTPVIPACPACPRIVVKLPHQADLHLRQGSQYCGKRMYQRRRLNGRVTPAAYHKRQTPVRHYTMPCRIPRCHPGRMWCSQSSHQSCETRAQTIRRVDANEIRRWSSPLIGCVKGALTQTTRATARRFDILALFNRQAIRAGSLICI